MKNLLKTYYIYCEGFMTDIKTCSYQLLLIWNPKAKLKLSKITLSAISLSITIFQNNSKKQHSFIGVVQKTKWMLQSSMVVLLGTTVFRHNTSLWNHVCLNLLFTKELFNNIPLSIKTRSVSNLINMVLRFVTILLCDFFLMLKTVLQILAHKKSRNILNWFLFKNNF